MINNHFALPALVGKEQDLIEESLSYISSYKTKTEEDKNLFLNSKILGSYLSGQKPSTTKIRVMLAESLDSQDISEMKLRSSSQRPDLNEKEQNLIEKARTSLKNSLSEINPTGKDEQFLLSNKILVDYFSSKRLFR